ncbi:neuronal acetylcholine receptor subunit alpha-4-like [Penaeus chinensis]|uniref:neuronal acetylcholine receptor subunit alpha-4-like n=1 Tax=Penaeus chinensis TaxID=139456 RepID=UPI001FB717F1|nr:neuronal acetylcholine receptor subunit alpha-4-like [Penaeus chinensis]
MAARGASSTSTVSRPWPRLLPPVFFLFLFLAAVLHSGVCSEDEERLVRDLFRGYNKLIRPVENMTHNVQVMFGLAFIQLINVNEKNQIMKSNVWLRLKCPRRGGGGAKFASMSVKSSRRRPPRGTLALCAIVTLGFNCSTSVWYNEVIF